MKSIVFASFGKEMTSAVEKEGLSSTVFTVYQKKKNPKLWTPTAPPNLKHFADDRINVTEML